MKTISSKSTDFPTVCLVATLFEEEQFIDEWLIYHRLLGIDHFFLYDDHHNLPLQELLRPHKDYVTVIPWQGKEKNNQKCSNQVLAYRHAMDIYLKDYKWVVFLDGDEFIVLREHQNIKDFLQIFHHPAVALNWHVFGHNGYYDDPTDLITLSLTRRKLEPVANIKCFTQTAFIKEINSMHLCELKSGHLVDANQNVYNKAIYPGKTSVAHINHYQTRSFKNWMKRAERGISHFIAGDCPPEQIWRTTSENCLKQFVTTVALDKNEYEDHFMSKFVFDLRKQIFLLNRQRSLSNYNIVISNRVLVLRLENILNQLIDLVMSPKNDMPEVGFENGKAGLAMFLFICGRFYNVQAYEITANKMLEECFQSMGKDSPLGFSEGLLGVCTVSQLLSDHCFIKVETDNLFDDVDLLIEYQIISRSLLTNIGLEDSVNTGKYLLARIRDGFRSKNSSKKKRLSKVLYQLIDQLIKEKYGINGMLNLTDLLINAYSLLNETYRAKVNSTLKIIMCNLNNKELVNNQHFYLAASLLAYKVYDLLKINEYIIMSEQFLDSAYRLHNHAEENSLLSTNQNWVVCHQLSQLINDSRINEISESFFSKGVHVLEFEIRRCTNSHQENGIFGGLTRFCHSAVALLIAVDEGTKDFITLYKY